MALEDTLKLEKTLRKTAFWAAAGLAAIIGYSTPSFTQDAELAANKPNTAAPAGVNDTKPGSKQEDPNPFYQQAAELEKQYLALLKTDKAKAEQLKKQADAVFVSGVEIDMRKGSVEKILEGIPVTYIKAPDVVKNWDKPEEPDWVKQYKQALNNAAKEQGVKGILVMWYGKGQGDAKILQGATLRQSIIMKRLAQLYGTQIKMVAIEAAYNDAVVDAYNCTWKKRWDLPPVRGPPSFVLCRILDDQTVAIDLKFGGPEDDRFRGSVANAKTWILYNVMGEAEKRGINFRYNNTSTLTKVEQKGASNE